MYLLCIFNDEENTSLSNDLYQLFIKNELDIYPQNLRDLTDMSEKNLELKCTDAIAYSTNVVFLLSKKFLQSKLYKMASIITEKLDKNVIYVHLEDLSSTDFQNEIFKSQTNVASLVQAKQTRGTSETILAYKQLDTINNKKIHFELYDELRRCLMKNVNKLFEKNELVEKMSKSNLEEVDVIYQALKANERVFEVEKNETRKFMIEMATKKHSEVTEKDILMYVLGKTFEQNGYEMVMSKKSIENDDLLQLHTKLWLHGFLFGLQVYKTVFEIDGDKTEINAQKIKSDPTLRNEFLENFVKLVCKVAHGVESTGINIVDIVDGSIAVIFTSTNPIDGNAVNRAAQRIEMQLSSANVRLRYAQTTEYRLIEQIVIPEDFLNVRYNMDYTNPFYRDRATTRGQENYYFPYGWKRYALNLTRFGYSDLNWLTMNNSDNEWSVAYHGIRESARMGVLEIARAILVGSSNNLRPGTHNAYRDVIDVNPRSSRRGQLCGVGVYCSPKIEVSTRYTSDVTFDAKTYRIALQCRINPKEYRVPSSARDYYIANSSDNIRPYGILLKCNQWT